MIDYRRPSAQPAPPQYSPDGRFWWDGATWQAVPSPPPPPAGDGGWEQDDQGWEPGSFPLWIGSLPTHLGALLTHHPGFSGMVHLVLKVVALVSTAAAVVLALQEQAAFLVAALVALVSWHVVWMMHLRRVAPHHYDTVNAVTEWLSAMLRQFNQQQAAQERWQAQQRQTAVQRELLYELRHEHHHHHHGRR